MRSDKRRTAELTLATSLWTCLATEVSKKAITVGVVDSCAGALAAKHSSAGPLKTIRLDKLNKIMCSRVGLSRMKGLSENRQNAAFEKSSYKNR